ncbi:MAG: hypothetical protein ACYDCN_05895 [Bacteroidia bacterium]
MKTIKLSIVIANAVKQMLFQHSAKLLKNRNDELIKSNLRDCFVISFLAMTFLILNSPKAMAKPVELATAQKVAENFYKQNSKTQIISVYLANITIDGQRISKKVFIN